MLCYVRLPGLLSLCRFLCHSRNSEGRRSGICVSCSAIGRGRVGRVTPPSKRNIGYRNINPSIKTEYRNIEISIAKKRAISLSKWIYNI